MAEEPRYIGADEFFPSMNDEPTSEFTTSEEPKKHDPFDLIGKTVATVICVCLAIVVCAVCIGGTIWVLKAVL